MHWGRFTAVAVSIVACHGAREEASPQHPVVVGQTSINVAVVKPAVPDPLPIAAIEEKKSCPDGMVLVDGEYCPDVEQTCLEWMDPPGPYQYFRCKRYAQPAKCKGARVHKRFCIDDRERVEKDSDLPVNKTSWTGAKSMCEANGARLCMTSEWQFACEGEEMRPYPYGWSRDSEACNADIAKGLGKVGGLVDHRTPASAHPKCTSAFGVHDMAGNVDEWATIDGAAPGVREVMKGSWWMPGRNHCRAYQGGHGAHYAGTESGVRCCKDAVSVLGGAAARAPGALPLDPKASE